jgi:hypothetical protein
MASSYQQYGVIEKCYLLKILPNLKIETTFRLFSKHLSSTLSDNSFTKELIISSSKS